MSRQNKPDRVTKEEAINKGESEVPVVYFPWLSGHPLNRWSWLLNHSPLMEAQIRNYSYSGQVLYLTWEQYDRFRKEAPMGGIKVCMMKDHRTAVQRAEDERAATSKPKEGGGSSKEESDWSASLDFSARFEQLGMNWVPLDLFYETAQALVLAVGHSRLRPVVFSLPSVGTACQELKEALGTLSGVTQSACILAFRTVPVNTKLHSHATGAGSCELDHSRLKLSRFAPESQLDFSNSVFNNDDLEDGKTVSVAVVLANKQFGRGADGKEYKIKFLAGSNEHTMLRRLQKQQQRILAILKAEQPSENPNQIYVLMRLMRGTISELEQ